MAKYILKRVLISIVTLWVLVSVVFILIRCMPGEPFQGEKMTPEIKANLETYYGFDKSLPEQYVIYKKFASGGFWLFYEICESIGE